MCVNNPLRIVVGGFVLCLLACTMLAKPPEVDFDDIQTARMLSPKHMEQLRARIGYWMEVIRSADEAKDVTDARESLLGDFQRIERGYYRDSFAGLTSQLAIPALANLPTGLKHLREVNIALALSRLPQVTVQPALEGFIVNANPAVRFLGWRGYRRIRPQVLARPPGTQFDQSMYRSLWARAAEESVAPVVGAIFQMIQMPPVRIEPVSEENFPRFQDNAFHIVQDSWAKRCREVLRDDGAMADACRKGIRVLENLAAVFKDDPAKRKAILQMVMDMTWCSARAYDNALRAVNQAARNQQKDEAARQSLEANVQLLRDCERALNELTKRDSRDIVRPMSDPNQLDRGSAVGLGVIEWLKALKAEGVTNPEPKFSAQPMTQPLGQAKAGK